MTIRTTVRLLSFGEATTESNPQPPANPSIPNEVALIPATYVVPRETVPRVYGGDGGNGFVPSQNGLTIAK